MLPASAIRPIPSHRYYRHRALLADVFRDDALEVTEEHIRAHGVTYPIIDEVIVLLPPELWPETLRHRAAAVQGAPSASARPYEARGIQATFGAEWRTFPSILPEHEREFFEYFDLIDLHSLSAMRAADLGCGIGRWSYFLAPHCREVLLVDFSEAIFVAQRNCAHCENALFFLGDVRSLPFRDDFADLIFSIGVLHHLPVPCLSEVVRLRRFAPRLLIYLYYALDNRPAYFRVIWRAADLLRRMLCKLRHEPTRRLAAWALTLTLYVPFVALGRMISALGCRVPVPLYEAHRNDSLTRICQDCYDRFFTGIEQRVSRRDIQGLGRAFTSIAVSPHAPYWHFLCTR